MAKIQTDEFFVDTVYIYLSTITLKQKLFVCFILRRIIKCNTELRSPGYFQS